MFEFPVLIGDIGGTNARFGLVERKGDKPRTLSHEATADNAGTVRRDPRRARQGRPRRAAAALDDPRHRGADRRAGDPAHERPLEGERRADRRGFRSVLGDDRERLRPRGGRRGGDRAARPHPHRAAAIPFRGAPAWCSGRARLRCGGAGAVFSSHLAIVSTEAGHTDIGPADSFEEKVWHALERVEDRITVETVLSGPGLARLHAAVAHVRTGRPHDKIDPAAVTEAGLDASDPHAVETLGLFARLLGRVCGDLALTFLATSGVYIGGGIAPRILKVLEESGFREAFRAQGALRGDDARHPHQRHHGAGPRLQRVVGAGQRRGEVRLSRAGLAPPGLTRAARCGHVIQLT